MQSWYCRNFMTNWLINLDSSPAILLPYTFVAKWVFFCLLATAAGTEGWNDVMVVLWLQTPWPCVRAMHQHEFKGGIAIWVTRPFSPSEHWDKDMQLAPAIKPLHPRQPSPPPPSEWSPIMSRGGNDVPLKSVLNQTQLIPLLSLIISIVDHIPLAGLLTSARASAKVTLGQAK